VPAITQKAPGMRVVVDGGEIMEIVPGELDRNRGKFPGGLLGVRMEPGG
jgi:hypothetical protein